MNESPQAEEPLEESAPLAWRLAPELCRKDPATGESCAWFHALWQVLRLLGLNTTPEHHAVFFRGALRLLPQRTDRPAVLISGTADYSLLARLLPSLRGSGRDPAVTVLDRCETPLMLNRWYAQRASYGIATRCSDILAYGDGDRFDGVFTHSFIGQFAPDQRQALMAAWHRLLRPDGLVATVNRIRPEASTGRTGFSAQQASALVETLRREGGKLAASLGTAPEALAEMAARYAARMGAWPIRTETELRGIFERNGFQVEHLAVAPVAIEGRALSGPTALGGAHYATVIARRR